MGRILLLALRSGDDIDHGFSNNFSLGFGTRLDRWPISLGLYVICYCRVPVQPLISASVDCFYAIVSPDAYNHDPP